MKTKTSSFGTSNREGHDASAYYSRNICTVTEDKESLPKEALLRNEIICGDSRNMKEVGDDSVALMVTSPPYHVGKYYDSTGTFEEYLEMLYDVWKETYRVLEPGGRAAINVAGLGRKPYVPLHHIITRQMQEIGFFMRGEIIWKKAEGASGSCAWGSFMKASNPVIRDVHEYILLFSKGRFGREAEKQKVKGESTISKEDFMAWTLSEWSMKPESAKRVKHPAPFPIELPRRCIELFTYKGDLVLDPFMGSGTTSIAALDSKRSYIGYDTSEEYCAIADSRKAMLEWRLINPKVNV